jgi:hypothetical protein
MADDGPGNPGAGSQAWSGLTAVRGRILRSFALIFLPVTAVFRLYYYLAVELRFQYAQFNPLDYLVRLSTYEVLCYSVFALLVLFIVYRDQEKA